MNPEAHTLGHTLPLWSVLPFVGLLLSIAVVPLVSPRFWARHYGKVSAGFGLPVAVWFLVVDRQELGHIVMEYISFLVLLGSLFTISGGILLRGTIRGTPAVNVLFLGVGSVIANLLGTTGASMLLIRPLLRANAWRTRSAHVVIFFIFLVSNIGGLLTPIGDPPLFLGYLRGVPFFWTLSHLWHFWLVGVGAVLAVFYLLDRRYAAAEAGPPPAEAPGGGRSLSLEGKGNFLLLAGVLGCVFLPTPWRETGMAACAIVSVWVTPARIREENEFTYHPIEEVAILFAGIFASMIPALLILKARGGEIGATQPWQFFWVTGILSSFLDNAPTYLTFLSLAQGLSGPQDVVGVAGPILQGISAGAVFMGANSYIGNAPNFMVKAIAEASGIRMPSFFAYMAISAVVLFPLYALVTWLFL